MKKIYFAIACCVLFAHAACQKTENDRLEDQRKVRFTADPVNGKVAFETIDNPTNVLKDEAYLNTSNPKQGDEGFIEQDKGGLDHKRKRYVVVGVIK